MAGTILHLLLWPRMLSQDKPLQPLLQLPSLLSSSLPLPQYNSSLLLHLPGEGSSRISNREDINSNNTISSLPLPINLQGGQVSSLLSSNSNSQPIRLLQLISSSSSRHPNLLSPQLLSQLSIKSSKMSWRALDLNANKVLLKITHLCIDCFVC